MYQANIKLVDDNNMLKNDIEVLEKRIKKATERMANYILSKTNDENCKVELMIIMSILNGEDYEQDNS